MGDYEINTIPDYRSIKLNNKDYLINKNLYLDIVLSDYCNTNCKFCVAETKEKKEVLNLDIQSTSHIDYAINTLGVKEVLLVGGEPTINNNLFDFLNYLSNFKLNKICLTTNGIRIFSDINYCERLFSTALSHLNISIMNLDSDKRKAIAQTNLEIDLNKIKSIKKIASKHNVKIRINNNIFLNNNDNLEDIIKFYNYFKTHVDSIKFSPLLKTKVFNTKSKVIDFTQNNTLSPEEYTLLFNSIKNHFKKYEILDNNNTLGFVKYSMIKLETPIILNWNHQNRAEIHLDNNIINSLKLLSNNTLSLDWNKEINKNTIKIKGRRHHETI